jgi:endonuclease/exonuclease/phosphatase (EEP) superfamily protein YafD
LKVYYANILYTNDDYESLKKQIEDDDYSMVMLVEFSDDHEEALKDRFQERFPYVNRTSWSTKLAGNVVFSKYPITDLTEVYSQESGKWRYGYFSVQRGEETFYFYVVHTSAPVSFATFEMRNMQLKKLKKDFLIQSQDRPKDASIVMVGDFNLSPWSVFYSQFMSGMDEKLHNVFRDYKPRFTRSLRGQKLLNVHIDHVFTSSGVMVGDFGVNDLLGSDHHAIVFDIESEK